MCENLNILQTFNLLSNLFKVVKISFVFVGWGRWGVEQEAVEKSQIINSNNFYKVVFRAAINLYKKFKDTKQSNFLPGQALSSLKQHVISVQIPHHRRICGFSSWKTGSLLVVGVHIYIFIYFFAYFAMNSSGNHIIRLLRWQVL